MAEITYFQKSSKFHRKTIKSYQNEKGCFNKRTGSKTKIIKKETKTARTTSRPKRQKIEARRTFRKTFKTSSSNIRIRTI